MTFFAHVQRICMEYACMHACIEVFGLVCDFECVCMLGFRISSVLEKLEKHHLSMLDQTFENSERL